MESRAVCTFFKPCLLRNSDVNRQGITSPKTDALTEVAKDNICDLEIVKGELKNFFSPDTLENLALVFKLLPVKINRLNEVCKQWRAASEIIYKSENQRLNYLSFCDNNSLSEKMTLTINDRVKLAVSMFRNLNYEFCEDEELRLNFNNLCYRFQDLSRESNESKKIFLSKDSYLIQFVNILNTMTQMSSEECIHSGRILENKYLALETAIEKKLIFASVLDCNTTFIDKGNRIILSFLYKKFILKELKQPEKEGDFQLLKTSLVGLINNHQTLKKLREISIENRTIENWEEILNLDPGRPPTDLRHAAECCYAAQNYKRAAECRMHVLNEGSADNRLEDLRLASLACAHAGFKIEVLNFNEEILKLAGDDATRIDLRNSAIGCDNAGLYMEASAYWLMYADKFTLGVNREDLDLIIQTFAKAGFTEVFQKNNHKIVLDRFDAPKQVFRDFALVCKKFEMKKHLADCWEKILEKAGENVTLDDIRSTGLAFNEYNYPDKVVEYMGLLIEKLGEEALESDLRIYAEACRFIDLKMSYEAWKKVLEKAGAATTMTDIRQMIIYCTGLGYHLEAVKYCEILLSNTVEEIMPMELMSISKIYEKAYMYDQAAACLKQRLQKLGKKATTDELRNISRLYSLADNDLEAVIYYERTISSSRKNPELADLRALAELYDKVGEYQKGYACREKVLEVAGGFVPRDDM